MFVQKSLVTDQNTFGINIFWSPTINLDNPYSIPLIQPSSTLQVDYLYKPSDIPLQNQRLNFQEVA